MGWGLREGAWKGSQLIMKGKCLLTGVSNPTSANSFFQLPSQPWVLCVLAPC